ncbi:transposase [Nakamurella sp. UYEF19]|uniref:IS1634 family transposase n=1 Tax=Nakamurella sp. UYEF19 TaxID=1756392 RepID=UPI003391A6EC
MASVYSKKVNGSTYYYLRQMARIEGKPKMVSERYLGSAADIEAALDRTAAGTMPDRTRHLRFGDVAAAWSMLTELDVAGIIDSVLGPRRRDAGASVGTYLALAALGRLVAPGSKSGFADFWAATAGDRFTKISPGVLDHRKFWDAMHLVTPQALQDISTRIAAKMIEVFALDTSSVALDMTNFATYIDTTNDKAPLAQRGKAKQKRTDLRLIGLGMVVTRTGGIPLVWHAYPGNRPDVTQFPTLIDHLVRNYTAATADNIGNAGNIGDAGDDQARGDTAAMTVVFDAGQNSAANFAHLADAGLHFVGSVPPSDCPDLLALPASRRRKVDDQQYPGVTAIDTHRVVYGADRRVVLTHSPNLHDDQARSFTGTTLNKVGRQLDELAATLERGKTRRSREQVTAEIDKITHDPWVREVTDWNLTGDTPTEHRLTWTINPERREVLEQRVFGKRILITDHPTLTATTPDGWPVVDVVAGYRSQSEIEFGFRQLKDPHQVSFSPMFHWTDHNIAVHTFTCVLALQLAHLLRLRAERAGHHQSVRNILDTLAGIQETVLIYPSTGGRPKARRITTDMTPEQKTLYDLFHLEQLAAPTPT